MIPPPAWQECRDSFDSALLRLFESLSLQIRTEIKHLMGQIKRVVGMIPPPAFSAASFESSSYEAAEFLPEIKERLSLKRCALLRQVVG